jgi:hypothetical protein
MGKSRDEQEDAPAERRQEAESDGEDEAPKAPVCNILSTVPDCAFAYMKMQLIHVYTQTHACLRFCMHTFMDAVVHARVEHGMDFADVYFTPPHACTHAAHTRAHSHTRTLA